MQIRCLFIYCIFLGCGFSSFTWHMCKVRGIFVGISSALFFHSGCQNWCEYSHSLSHLPAQYSSFCNILYLIREFHISHVSFIKKKQCSIANDTAKPKIRVGSQVVFFMIFFVPKLCIQLNELNKF